LLENTLHGPVARIIESQRPYAGRFQARGTILYRQTDNTLDSPQIVQYPVSQQLLDNLQAARSNLGRLPATPLGGLALPGQGLWGHVFINAGARSRVFKPGMDRHKIKNLFSQMRVSCDRRGVGGNEACPIQLI
jgi:hypothetical protein